MLDCDEIVVFAVDEKGNPLEKQARRSGLAHCGSGKTSR